MGLLKTAARAAVATRVIGSVHRRQSRQWAQQDAAAAAAAPLAAPVVDSSALIQQLTDLGRLRDQGVLTPAEFEVQKSRLLGGT